MIDIHGEKVIDLTHTMEHDIPGMPGFTNPTMTWLPGKTRGEGCLFNAEEWTVCPHTGTHMDAPWHFFEDGKTIEELDPTCLLGSAVVIRYKGVVDDEPFTVEATEAYLKSQGETIHPGDAVLLQAGHDKKWGIGEAGDEFTRDGWPYISPELAQYFVDKKVRFVGLEAMNVDSLNAPDCPSHKILLGNEVLIVENLKNLDQLDKRCQILALPLKLKDGTGSNIRILAVE